MERKIIWGCRSEAQPSEAKKGGERMNTTRERGEWGYTYSDISQLESGLTAKERRMAHRRF